MLIPSPNHIIVETTKEGFDAQTMQNEETSVMKAVLPRLLVLS